VVAASLQSGNGGHELFDKVMSEAELKSIPVLALADSDVAAEAGKARARECKFDRAAVLRSLKVLSTETMCTSVRAQNSGDSQQ